MQQNSGKGTMDLTLNRFFIIINVFPRYEISNFSPMYSHYHPTRIDIHQICKYIGLAHKKFNVNTK